MRLDNENGRFLEGLLNHRHFAKIFFPRWLFFKVHDSHKHARLRTHRYTDALAKSVVHKKARVHNVCACGTCIDHVTLRTRFIRYYRASTKISPERRESSKL